MSQLHLSRVEIQDFEFRTTGQRNNSGWKAQRYEKGTSSNFGRASGVMENPRLTNVQRLLNDLYNPKNVNNIPAIRWCVEYESVAMDADQHMTGVVLQPTVIWIFHNNIIGASPDGLSSQNP